MKASTREREHLERTQDILNTAEELFLANGFYQTSMDVLAKKSEYTKRTIYNYFSCKEDLYFAVALKGYGQLHDMVRAAYIAKDSGLENIRHAYSAFYDFYVQFPQQLQLITLTELIKQYPTNVTVPYRGKLEEARNVMFQDIVRLFFAAKKDGSILSDEDINQLAYSSIFVAVSFFHIFSLSGTSYVQLFRLDKETFIKFCMDRLLESFGGQQARSLN